jgi:hypothetical protein
VRLSNQYLATYETVQEVKDAILLRMTIIRNKTHMPDAVEIGLQQEIEQLKFLMKHKFNEDFG